YLVLYNSKRPHKSLELMTPVDYILRESKNCNMWWTHTHRLLYWALHRSMTAWLQVVSARLCDFPDLSSD
ncbi:hypothetical protein M2X71_18960, partial [Klebsiella pneumoniae]|nr:hypothetical protein [Klebsiella pneumoniae]